MRGDLVSLGLFVNLAAAATAKKEKGLCQLRRYQNKAVDFGSSIRDMYNY